MEVDVHVPCRWEDLIMTSVRETADPVEILELHNGDRMSQKEFHRIYSQMPEDFKAELIGGIVYLASPRKIRHGTNHILLGSVFGTYEGNTPGTEAGSNTTVILSDEGEPQPDLCLRILHECGGQSRTDEDDYIVGAPELLAEIALTSRSIDLHGKRDDYAQHGVLEYLVLSLRETKLHWFDLRANQELKPEPDGVFRIRSFPGLWIHGEALLAKDYQRTMAVLNQGLATPEHAEFVRRLAGKRAGGRESAAPSKDERDRM
jgi:Uma2 family endonuclease